MAGSRRRRQLRNERLGYLLVTFVIGMTVSFAVLSRVDPRMNTVLARKVFRIERFIGAGVLPLKILFGVRGVGGADGLLDAITRRDNVHLKILLDSGVPPDGEGPEGVSALNRAISLGSIDSVRLLLSRGAGASRIDSSGSTPLLVAAKAGSLSLVEELLASGADPNQRSPKGETALLIAIREQNSQLLELLLSQRVNVNLAGTGGVTPLHEAIRSGNSVTVSTLLDAGANASARDINGDNALIYAVRSRSIPITARLLTTELDPLVRNEQGETALELAQKEGGEIALFLEKILQEEPKAGEDIPITVTPTTSPTITPSPTPRTSSLLTRLRLVAPVEGTWKKQGALALSTVRVLVKNVGEFAAEGVQVRVRIPGGAMFPVPGPTVIGRGNTAEYFGEVNVIVKRTERLREELTCKNCYR